MPFIHNPKFIDTTKYFIGLSRDGYYNPTSVTDANISNGKISVTSSNEAGYGLGLAIEVLPNTIYSLSAKSTDKPWEFSYALFDENGNLLTHAKSSVFTTTEKTKFCGLFFNSFPKVESIYSDICANLSHSGNRDGEYEEYEEFVRELPNIELKSTHNVFDELTAEKHIQRVGVRAYQEGDENDATLLTDKVTTHYPLEEEIVTEFAENEMPNLNYKVWDYGTEQIIPRGELTSPIKADIVYTQNIVDQADNNLAEIKNLQQQIASLQQQLIALASNG
jgi:hypothetical protein